MSPRTQTDRQADKVQSYNHHERARRRHTCNENFTQLKLILRDNYIDGLWYF